jgi:hypothetical protein
MKRTLFDDTYLAGLWKNHIVNQLLWMTYKNLDKGYQIPGTLLVMGICQWEDCLPGYFGSR